MSSMCDEVSILSIDAWADGPCGWSWNAWYKVGQCKVDVCELSTRKLLRFMREIGVLGANSAGHVSVEDDGYNMVVVDRHSRMPLYAIAYGEASQ